MDSFLSLGKGLADSAACIISPNPNMCARIEAEKVAFRTSLFFVPEPYLTGFIKWYQVQRTWLGFQPPTLTQMPILLVAIPMILAIITSRIYYAIIAGFNLFMAGIQGKLRSDTSKIGFIVVSLIILFILIALLFYFFAPDSSQTYTDVTTTQSLIGTKSGFQNMTKTPVKETAYKLVNIQPLSIKQTGFVGPSEVNGKFDITTGIQTAIRSGATFFTLQIDYLEREQDTALFEPVGVPTLLYRSASGKLIGKNGGSIKEVAQEFVNYMFNPDYRATKYPVILYLHFVRTPDPVKKPLDYLNFLKKVSEALEPIQPYILTSAGDNYRRQKSESSLLELPLSTIENSIILLTNADTTIFRNTQATGGVVNPISDLDSFVNMRVYLDDSSDSLGVTQVATNGIPNAVIIPYSKLKSMSASEKTTFAMKGKKRFVIAMPSQLENPTYAELKSLLNDTGVNAIPLNLIGTDPAPVNKIISLWANSMPFYMVKQMMLQSYSTQVSPNSAPTYP